jgi:hypothetical protein
VKRGLLVVLLLAAQAAGAAPPPRHVIQAARERFERANRLYHEGRYAEALLLYQAAYDLVPSPDFLLNLGLTKEKTLDYEGCAVALAQFLKAPTSREKAEQAAQRIENCRARATIPVRVSSMPPSAAVYLVTGGQRSLRGRTPTRLALAPGTFELSVEHPGYQRQTQKVVVEIGTRPDIDFTLERLSALRVEADVAGAQVQIDDGPPEDAPAQRELLAGLHRIRVTRGGHQPVTRQVRIEPGQTTSLVVSLPALPVVRQLAVESSVAANVSLDGRDQGRTPLRAPVVTGYRRLEVHAPGFVRYASEVRVQDHDVQVRVRLAPAQRRWERAVSLALLGATAAGAVAATAYSGLALRDQHEYVNGVPTRSLLDQTRSHARTADGLWIGTAVLAAGTVVFYLVTRSRKSHATVE